MSVTPSTIATPFTFAGDLLTVCSAALAATVGGTVPRAYVSPGLPALDCECVVVTPVGLAQAPTSPSDPGMAVARRLSRFYVNELGFSITIARDCMPVVANNYGGPNAPTVAQLESAAQVLTEDVWAVWNAIDAAFRTGDLFEGRCSFLYLDGAFALATSGAIGGWQIDLRTQIDGIP